MKHKVFEIWGLSGSDGREKVYIHTALDRSKAQAWCDVQIGVMGTPAPNDHHWVKEVEVSEKGFKKINMRIAVLNKIKPVLTPEELKSVVKYPEIDF